MILWVGWLMGDLCKALFVNDMKLNFHYLSPGVKDFYSLFLSIKIMIV
jgi:hypothetical protein